MAPTIEQYKAFQSIFDYFNASFFNSQLSGVILSFSRKSRAYGFFAPQRWQYVKDKTAKHEISLNPDHLKRNPKEVLSTLLHEMVHLWQQDYGTPPRRAYHNKEWAKEMERVGLIPSHDGTVNGKKTGQSMTHYIQKDGPFDKVFREMPKDILFPFLSSAEALVEKKKKRVDKVKYCCYECEVNVWGKSGLHVVCGQCESKMVEE